MKNIEKPGETNEGGFSGLLNQLKNSLTRNVDKKDNKENKEEKNDDNSQKKELLTLEQEIRNKYDQYEKWLKEKELEEREKLPYFKNALKNLKGKINNSQKELENRKPQLDVYDYNRETFDLLEKKFGRKNVLNLIESIVSSGIQPRRNDEKGAADKGRIDAILSLYDGTPDIIAQLLF
ncbi:MAG: hypothetical protein PHR61_03340 [Candidatus Absconditabacteria bacterium]|nr:hypothetical protein [Candidatus Absconditabacteria bacterium]